MECNPGAGSASKKSRRKGSTAAAEYIGEKGNPTGDKTVYWERDRLI